MVFTHTLQFIRFSNYETISIPTVLVGFAGRWHGGEVNSMRIVLAESSLPTSRGDLSLLEGGEEEEGGGDENRRACDNGRAQAAATVADADDDADMELASTDEGVWFEVVEVACCEDPKGVRLDLLGGILMLGMWLEHGRPVNIIKRCMKKKFTESPALESQVDLQPKSFYGFHFVWSCPQTRCPPPSWM
jgi:hypothetical protein